jgi:hypothetical protein
MAERLPEQVGDFCVYCGSLENLDYDHVPPENIFPKPRPKGLITVRSCIPCNGGASKDDEYFRMMLCLNNDVGESPEAQKNWPAILRSLGREQAIGMRTALLKSIHPVQAMTWGGIYLGEMTGYDVKLDRINRVISRTVRGLYFHEQKRRMPDDHDVYVWCDETLIRLQREDYDHFQQKLIQPVMSEAPKVVAPGVFDYRFLMFDDGPGSIWLLSFYERKSFLAITGPKNLIGERKERSSEHVQ